MLLLLSTGWSSLPLSLKSEMLSAIRPNPFNCCSSISLLNPLTFPATADLIVDFRVEGGEEGFRSLIRVERGAFARSSLLSGVSGLLGDILESSIAELLSEGVLKALKSDSKTGCITRKD